MSKKVSLIIIVIVLVILSLVISIYMPNKEKIEKKEEETSISYYLLKREENFGIINEQGEIIVEPQYSEIIIPNSHKPVFLCYKEDEAKILNSQNQEIFKEYNNVEAIQLANIISESAYEKNVLRYEKDGKYGLLGIDGNVVVEAKYQEISSLGFKEGEILVKENDKYGIIDELGNKIIKNIYDSIVSDQYYSSEVGYKKSGYIVCDVTEEGYRYGYYDSQGGMILEAEYNQILRISEVKNSDEIYLIASKNGQYGVFINNNKIINNQYQSITYDNGIGVFIVERTGKYGAINEKGLEILKPEYSSLDIKGIYMYTKKDEESKVFDRTGKEITIPENTIIEETDSTDYYIKIERTETENYKILNSNFEEITKNQYSYLEYLQNNYFIATNLEGKNGIIDSQENIIVEFKYDLIQKIKEKDAIQATNFETNVTDIYNNELKNTTSLSNINIQKLEDYIKIYNEEQEVYLDNNGNKIEDEQKLDEIKKNNAILRIGNFKRVTYSVEQYYYVEENLE